MIMFYHVNINGSVNWPVWDLVSMLLQHDHNISILVLPAGAQVPGKHVVICG